MNGARKHDVAISTSSIRRSKRQVWIAMSESLRPPRSRPVKGWLQHRTRLVYCTRFRCKAILICRINHGNILRGATLMLGKWMPDSFLRLLLHLVYSRDSLDML